MVSEWRIGLRSRARPADAATRTWRRRPSAAAMEQEMNGATNELESPTARTLLRALLDVEGKGRPGGSKKRKSQGSPSGNVEKPPSRRPARRPALAGSRCVSTLFHRHTRRDLRQPRERGSLGSKKPPASRKPLKYKQIPWSPGNKRLPKECQRLRKASKDFQKFPEISKSFRRPPGPGDAAGWRADCGDGLNGAPATTADRCSENRATRLRSGQGVSHQG